MQKKLTGSLNPASFLKAETDGIVAHARTDDSAIHTNLYHMFKNQWIGMK